MNNTCLEIKCYSPLTVSHREYHDVYCGYKKQITNHTSENIVLFQFSYRDNICEGIFM